MLKAFYLLYFSIVIVGLLVFTVFFMNRADQFTRALELMELTQSQSLAAWELTDKQFNLLTAAYDDSFTHLYESVGHNVSEDGFTIDTAANSECERCFSLADLRDSVSTQDEYDALVEIATINSQSYHEEIGELVRDITTNTRQQNTIFKLTDDINERTQDARLRVRYIRWFFEYRKTRDLGPSDEFASEE